MQTVNASIRKVRQILFGEDLADLMEVEEKKEEM